MTATNKEEIYDAQINPLMAQIIAICKQHKIAMLATFAIPNEEDDALVCTSALLESDYDPPESFLDALEAVKPRRPVVIAQMEETRPDGTKHITITRIS